MYNKIVFFIKCTFSAIFASFLINTFVFSCVCINGISMLPTLRGRDRVIIDKVTYLFSKPKSGDIVVVKNPFNKSELLIKRIAAVEGERVKIDNHKLYVNGVEKEEKYIKEPMDSELDINFSSEHIIPKNHICVLGDNRNYSDDSRDLDNINFIPYDYIEGKASIRIYPFKKVGLIK